jgi:putative transposase
VLYPAAVENSNPPRKTMKRIEVGGHARNLNFACFHNMPLLRSQRSCEWVVDRLVHAANKHNIAIWAWCIMPTHLHLLVLPRGTRTVRPNMSRFLFSLKQPVAKRAIAWTRQHAPEFLPRLMEVGKDGVPRPHFWQPGGGYDRNLWSADVIWNTIDYIHMNPVEAGLCKRSIDWKWSSAARYAGDKSSRVQLDLSCLRPDPRRT